MISTPKYIIRFLWKSQQEKKRFHNLFKSFFKRPVDEHFRPVL